eukprot:TRINITY_DN17302_c0_g1_i2.p1 TRINITY_DN17302_c0_g1~~TRINITY_DN17302_c0_g1_i2.p1  ORF type:complete len:266 (+),score=44.36 TRINITY_DN17302_c0_g1_i2:69-866(+)
MRRLHAGWGAALLTLASATTPVPISRYTFDDGTLLDLGPAANTASTAVPVVTTPAVCAPMSGRALHLELETGYCIGSSINMLSPGSYAVSLHLKAKLPSSSGNKRVLINAGDDCDVSALKTDRDGEMFLGGLQSAGRVDLTVWNHIVMIYDHTVFTSYVYVNGALFLQKTPYDSIGNPVSMAPDPSRPLCIGRCYGRPQQQKHEWYIDNVMLFDGATTLSGVMDAAAEVCAPTPVPPTPAPPVCFQLEGNTHIMPHVLLLSGRAQ